MELIDYPQAILDASKEFLAYEQQVQELQQKVDKLRHVIHSEAAFDPKLKNQNQRDARINELLNTSPDYQAALAQLTTARSERYLARTELEFLRNKFSAIKLSILAKLEFLNRIETPQDVRIQLAGMGLQGLFSNYYTTRSTTPEEAAEKIDAFVEAVIKQLKTTDSVWAQGIQAPEFYHDEPEESELDDDEPEQ